uniref:Terpene synthase n=1 Tax=Psilocybe cubensis TaxID=181762 RepID=A0A8H7Y3N7_PSICU
MASTATLKASCYLIPDVLREWPYKRMINPYYRAAQEQSVKWLEGFRPFSPEAQIAFDKCDFSMLSKTSCLIGALTIPHASYDLLRSYCDLMNTFFVLDEYTDVTSVEDTQLLCEVSIDAIFNPDRPRADSDPLIGKIARQFWQGAMVHASHTTRERFMLSWKSYVDSIIIQASRRNNSRYICTFDEYMAARRDNIGSYPCFAFLEMSLNLDIPHEIMEHPTIVQLQKDTTDMILLFNDIASYKKEFLADDADYNAVTVVMHHHNVNVQDAVNWICDIHQEIANNFLKLRDEVKMKVNFPDFGEEINHQIEAYVDGLG